MQKKNPHSAISAKIKRERICALVVPVGYELFCHTGDLAYVPFSPYGESAIDSTGASQQHFRRGLPFDTDAEVSFHEPDEAGDVVGPKRGA